MLRCPEDDNTFIRRYLAYGLRYIEVPAQRSPSIHSTLAYRYRRSVGTSFRPIDR